MPHIWKIFSNFARIIVRCRFVPAQKIILTQTNNTTSDDQHNISRRQCKAV